MHRTCWTPRGGSFEALFPRLRPGGLYLIEDWNSAHILRDVFAAAFKDTSAPDYEARLATFREALAKSRKSDAPPVTPLSHLALELVLARVVDRGVHRRGRGERVLVGHSPWAGRVGSGDVPARGSLHRPLRFPSVGSRLNDALTDAPRVSVRVARNARDDRVHWRARRRSRGVGCSAVGEPRRGSTRTPRASRPRCSGADVAAPP